MLVLLFSVFLDMRLESCRQKYEGCLESTARKDWCRGYREQCFNNWMREFDKRDYVYKKIAVVDLGLDTQTEAENIKSFKYGD